jgi:cytosine/adenosine deaminase-related metal-dependent hydrolase
MGDAGNATNPSRSATARVDRRALMTSAAAMLASTAIAGIARPAVAQRGPVRTLLKGGVVLSYDPAVGDFERADVLIEDKKIAAVRPDISADAAVIDASQMIVLPGFIDTHHHFYQSALRNVLPNGVLADYFRDISGAATNHYRPEDAYIGNLIGALRSLDAGITTITDLSQVSNTPEHSDALIKGLTEAGIRAIYAYSRGSGSLARWPGDVERLQKQYFSSTDQLVTLALGTAVNKEQWLLARRFGLRIFTHVVGGNRGLGPEDVIKLGDEGLMGPDNVYIHFTGATNDQMRRVKETGGWLSIACPIEMAMRHGMPPIQQALDAGIRPSLSSDVETTMAADMFTQMRAVFTLQRARLNERSIKGEKELPPLLNAREVIEFATLQGARADGMEAKIGTLTPGKEADIVMLRTDLTNTLPFNSAYGAIVTAMDTSNVDTVIVAGKVAKRAGRLVGVDLDRVARDAAASRDYLVGKLGWPRSVIDTSLSGH